MSRDEHAPHGERIAFLEAYSKTQKDALHDLKDSIDKLNTQVALLNTALSKAKGGWIAISAIGTIAGTIGALLVSIFHK